MVEKTLTIPADEAARDLAALNLNLEEHIPLAGISLDVDLGAGTVTLRWEEAGDEPTD